MPCLPAWQFFHIELFLERVRPNLTLVVLNERTISLTAFLDYLERREDLYDKKISGTRAAGRHLGLDVPNHHQLTVV
jgi:hypothetical protein